MLHYGPGAPSRAGGAGRRFGGSERILGSSLVVPADYRPMLLPSRSDLSRSLFQHPLGKADPPAKETRATRNRQRWGETAMSPQKKTSTHQALLILDKGSD